MGLPRTFIGLSSTDIKYYRLMQAWKAHEHIDFDFADCQLHSEINSEDVMYPEKNRLFGSETITDFNSAKYRK